MTWLTWQQTLPRPLSCCKFRTALWKRRGVLVLVQGWPSAPSGEVQSHDQSVTHTTYDLKIMIWLRKNRAKVCFGLALSLLAAFLYLPVGVLLLPLQRKSSHVLHAVLL